MKKDPIVEEIRNIRQAHAAKFQYDLKAICVDLKEKKRRRSSAGLIPGTYVDIGISAKASPSELMEEHKNLIFN